MMTELADLSQTKESNPELDVQHCGIGSAGQRCELLGYLTRDYGPKLKKLMPLPSQPACILLHTLARAMLSRVRGTNRMRRACVFAGRRVWSVFT